MFERQLVDLDAFDVKNKATRAVCANLIRNAYKIYLRRKLKKRLAAEAAAALAAAEAAKKKKQNVSSDDDDASFYSDDDSDAEMDPQEYRKFLKQIFKLMKILIRNSLLLPM